MKPLDDRTHDDYEATAREGLKALRAYLAYSGDNPLYERKAKAGAVAVAGGAASSFGNQRRCVTGLRDRWHPFRQHGPRRLPEHRSRGHVAVGDGGQSTRR